MPDFSVGWRCKQTGERESGSLLLKELQQSRLPDIRAFSKQCPKNIITIH
jgi:hypothetical protein